MLPKDYDWEEPGALLIGLLDIQDSARSYLDYSLSKRGIGLSYARLSLLRAIERDGPCTPSLLALRMGIARASITEGLKKLSDYIEATPDPDDHRSLLVAISPSGRAALTGAAGVIKQIEQELFGKLPVSLVRKWSLALKLTSLRFRDIDARAPVDVRKRQLRKRK